MIRSDIPGTTHRSAARPVGAPVRAVLTLLTVVALVLAALAAQRPPPALGAGAAVDRFSAGRAVEHLRVIAREPHAVGTAAAADVRDYLVAELGALGLETEVQRTTAVSERFRVTGLVENVLGRLRGSDPSGAILLVAHYDSVTTAPGAADNGAAVAAILEGLRALADGTARHLTLRVASARDATQLALLVHPDTPVEALLVNGRRLESLPRPNGWTRLVVYGRVSDGVTVELVTGADAVVELVVIDQTHDLFDHDALNVPPRPAGTMPAPSRMSDAVLVARAWTAPPSGATIGEAD